MPDTILVSFKVKAFVVVLFDHLFYGFHIASSFLCRFDDSGVGQLYFLEKISLNVMVSFELYLLYIELTLSSVYASFNLKDLSICCRGVIA